MHVPIPGDVHAAVGGHAQSADRVVECEQLLHADRGRSEDQAECPNDVEHSLMDVFVSVPAFRSGLLYMLSPYYVVRLMEANDVSYREGLTRAEVTYMPIYRTCSPSTRPPSSTCSSTG
jgi:hypothetical protein